MEVEIKIMMIGDVLMHDRVLQSGCADDNTYHFGHLFRNISDSINNADIRIVNQETILAGEELGISGYPRFNSPFELGDAEANAGFNVILHATNHALDKGIRGIDRCINFWESNHPDVAVLGINASQESTKDIYVYEKEGFRVAILNYTFESNIMPIPENKSYLINMFDRDRMRNDIRNAKQIADIVVVCPHWGTEYVIFPDENQRVWVQFFLEEGVDIVMGTHPHVLQPVEILQGTDDNQMLVYYSLGNFISNQFPMERLIGGMAEITLVKDNTGSYVSAYSLTPVITHKASGYEGFSSYKLSDYTDALADINDIKTIEGCDEFSIKYINDMCSFIMGTN